MPHITKFGSNNTENGWLYKAIDEKMLELDKQIQTVKNLIDSIDMTNFGDYSTLVTDMSNKADITFVKRHIDDSTSHITAQERARWNRYLGGIKLMLNFKGMVHDISDLPDEGNEMGNAYQVVDPYGENTGYIYIWNGSEWIKLVNFEGMSGKDGK